jgi:hypothetical protein
MSRSLDEIESALDDIVLGIERRTRQTAQVLTRVEKVIDSISRKLEQRADRRMSRPIASIDVARVDSIIGRNLLDELTAREARYAVRAYHAYPPQVVRQIVTMRPSLLGTLLRALLMDWLDIVSSPSRASEASLLVDFVAKNNIYQGPIPLTTLFRADAPALCASQLDVSTFLAAQESIAERLKFGRTWTIMGFTMAAMLRSQGAGELWNNNEALESLVQQPDHDDVRRLLLPLRSARLNSQGPAPTGQRAVRWQFVAELLTARFSRPTAIRERIFDRVEPFLLDGDFGDPRVNLASEDWDHVRRLAPQAYESFYQGLIKGDLEFFFAEAMSEIDRKEYWLRYTGSIRRTIAVLDDRVYGDLSYRLRQDGGPMLAALRRAKRAGWSRSDGLCAFCMVFDEVVAVEFSVTGNALYLYPRAYFDSHVAELLDGRTAIPEPGVLKNSETGTKFTHSTTQGRPNWHGRVDIHLRSYGILPNRSRRRT